MSKIARAHKVGSGHGSPHIDCESYIQDLWQEPRSVHMQQSPACHLQGIVSGDAWTIYGMLVLECLRVPGCTASLHGTVTMQVVQ